MCVCVCVSQISRVLLLLNLIPIKFSLNCLSSNNEGTRLETRKKLKLEIALKFIKTPSKDCLKAQFSCKILRNAALNLFQKGEVS